MNACRESKGHHARVNVYVPGKESGDRVTELEVCLPSVTDIVEQTWSSTAAAHSSFSPFVSAYASLLSTAVTTALGLGDSSPFRLDRLSRLPPPTSTPSTPLDFVLTPLLHGGKGGFGSLLRGGGRKKRKDGDVEEGLYRDLQGRRVRPRQEAVAKQWREEEDARREARLGEEEVKRREREVQREERERREREAEEKAEESEWCVDVSAMAKQAVGEGIRREKEEAIALGGGGAGDNGQRKKASVAPRSAMFASLLDDDEDEDEDDDEEEEGAEEEEA